MDLTTRVFFYSAPGLWFWLPFFSFIGLASPLREIRKNWHDHPVRRKNLLWLLTRLLLLCLLLPPFVWAVTVGHWGARIRLQDKELTGVTCFNRFLGKVDLTGVSLRLERRRQSRGSAWVLVGAKKREELQIDGFVDHHGNTLIDLVLKEFKIPMVEIP